MRVLAGTCGRLQLAYVMCDVTCDVLRDLFVCCVTFAGSAF